MDDNAIAGVAVGGVVVLILLLILAQVYRHRSNNNDANNRKNKALNLRASIHTPLDDDSVSLGRLLTSYQQFRKHAGLLNNRVVDCYVAADSPSFRNLIFLLAKTSALEHKNIVRFIGNTQQLIVVAENCSLGRLDHLLESEGRFNLNSGALPISSPPTAPQERPTTLERNLGIAAGVASGLTFLHGKGVVLGDVATRNILLTEGLEPKITNCHLGVLLEPHQIFFTDLGGDSIFRWLAPEVTDQGHDTTPAADAWQMGLFLYELFSHAQVPYNSKSYRSEEEMLEAFSLLRNGTELLPMPQDCEEAVYSLMRSCWSQNPRSRPVARIIEKQLRLLSAEIEEEDEDEPAAGFSSPESWAPLSPAIIHRTSGPGLPDEDTISLTSVGTKREALSPHTVLTTASKPREVLSPQKQERNVIIDIAPEDRASLPPEMGPEETPPEQDKEGNLGRHLLTPDIPPQDNSMANDELSKLSLLGYKIESPPSMSMSIPGHSGFSKREPETPSHLKAMKPFVAPASNEPWISDADNAFNATRQTTKSVTTAPDGAVTKSIVTLEQIFVPP